MGFLIAATRLAALSRTTSWCISRCTPTSSPAVEPCSSWIWSGAVDDRFIVLIVESLDRLRAQTCGNCRSCLLPIGQLGDLQVWLVCW